MAVCKSGRTWYFVKRMRGQRFCVSTGASSKTVAAVRAAQMEEDIRAGRRSWNAYVPTLADWWEVYEKSYKPRVPYGARVTAILGHFMSVHGRKRLTEFTCLDVARFEEQQRSIRSRAEGTEPGVRRLVQIVFDWVIEAGYDVRNPAHEERSIQTVKLVSPGLKMRGSKRLKGRRIARNRSPLAS